MTDNPERRQLATIVGILAVLFAGLVVLVQPWNWVPLDDDWAYVLTTRTLVAEGRYRLHDWATASIMPQAWLGSLFVRVVGDRFPAFLAVNVVLETVAGLGVYLLARDLRLSRLVSAVCAASVLFCPLMLRGGFSYMSDVPFTTFLILAFLCYGRGVDRQNLAWTLAGSLCAAAAILSRQIGAFILVAMAASAAAQAYFLKTDHRRRPRRVLVHYGTAAAIPLGAILYQFYLAQTSPSWAQLHSIVRLKTHLLGPWRVLAIDLIWRFAIIFQYLALFLLPLALLLIRVHGARMIDALKTRARVVPAELALAAAFMGAGLVIGVVPTHLWRTDKLGTLLPSLRWNLTVLEETGLGPRALLTLVTLLGGTFLLASLIGHYRHAAASANRALNGTGLIEWTTLGLLTFHLLFFQIGDEYLLDLLPFTALFMALNYQREIERYYRGLLILLVLTTTLTGIWLRGDIERGHAYWQAGQSLLSQGIPLERIGSRWTWHSYHGEFDRFLAHIDRQTLPDFEPYLAHLRRLDLERHDYFVAESRNAIPVFGKIPIQPEPLATFAYRDAFLRRRSVAIWKADR